MAWRALLSSDLAKRIAARTEVNGELIRSEDMETYMEQLSKVDPGKNSLKNSTCHTFRLSRGN